MKHFIILSLLFCCYSMTGYSQFTPPPKGEIKLQPTITGPVSAFQNENYVKVSFTKDEGNVNVTMKSTETTVYKNTVSSAVGSSLTIDTTGWARGVYTLRITNKIGFSIAEFTVNYQ